MTTIPATAPSGVGTRRPAVAVTSAVFQAALGSLTSVAGAVFSLQAGGGWAVVAAPLFVVALVLWWVGAAGLVRGRRRGWLLGLAMLAALFCFGIYKIVWIHESAAYVFQSLTLIGFALQLAPPTRRWASR